MRNIRFAFVAAAALTVFSSISANAYPAPPTAFVPQAGVIGPFSDNLFVFKPGTGVIEGLGVTKATIDACTTAFAGGCLFDIPNTAGILFNQAQIGRFTLVFEPDGHTVSDIFGVRCTATCNLAFLSDIDGQKIDLTGIDTSSFYAVTELAKAPVTVFDATYYLDLNWRRANSGAIARFVSANDVPEPATLTILGAGIAGAAAFRRRKKRA